MSHTFISDPREVVRSGQVVKVKVMEADPERKRISLTLRLDDDAAEPGGRSGTVRPSARSVPEGRGKGHGASGAPKAGAPKVVAAKGGTAKTGAAKTGAPKNSAPKAGAPKAGTPKSSAPAGAMAEALRAAGLLK